MPGIKAMPAATYTAAVSPGGQTPTREEWIAKIDNARDGEEESQEYADEQWDQWYQEHGGDSSKDFYDEEGKLWRYDAEAGRHGEADWYDDDGNRWTYAEERSSSEKGEVAAAESQIWEAYSAEIGNGGQNRG